jgi:hypothetical protein
MPLLHDCPGCGYPGVPYNQLACAACWQSLPRHLRDKVTTAYNHDERAHRFAVAVAARWLREARQR